MAGCAAVDGTLEVRVNEPPRRGWLRRREPGAERALEALGFVPGYDCWQATVGTDPAAVARGAELVDRALPPEVELVPQLVHPGLSAWTTPPPPSAPAEEHVRAAVETLVRARAGKASFDTRRPARNDAWAFATPPTLVVDADDPAVDLELPIDDPASAETAVDAIVATLSDRPLFVALIGVRDPPAT
ncbi:MAG TPA: hypothetical protein VGW10_19340, partial [Solirubrobacteraceae bacterium]|nr:hypothetical protein [Solirubrobacteraceae bacterium]